MTKKYISLLMMVAISFGAISTIQSQESTSKYKMWEDIMITPDYTKLKILGENMRKHNQKYHKSGTYKATVYNIATGPNSGKMIWEMGPMTYTELDSRPSAGGHDEDWRDNVMPYIKKIETSEYWKEDDKLSNVGMLDGDNSKYPLLFIRYHEVSSSSGDNTKDILTKISETIKAMEGENPWGIYYNEFRQGTTIGRHIQTIGFMKNWAEMDDESNNFKKTFLKVHGEDSWDGFIETWKNTFSNSWDEIWEYNPNLSGR